MKFWYLLCLLLSLSCFNNSQEKRTSDEGSSATTSQPVLTDVEPFKQMQEVETPCNFDNQTSECSKIRDVMISELAKKEIDKALKSRPQGPSIKRIQSRLDSFTARREKIEKSTHTLSVEIDFRKELLDLFRDVEMDVSWINYNSKPSTYNCEKHCKENRGGGRSCLFAFQGWSGSLTEFNYDTARMVGPAACEQHGYKGKIHYCMCI